MARFPGWVLVALMSAGCTSGENELPRQAVSGKVTLDGAPLAKGQIVFSPTAAASVTRTGGPIVDGSYHLAKSEGPVPGPYTVIISAGSTIEGDPDDPAKKVTPTPDPVPAKYNARTTLHVEVKGDGSNVLDFPLTSK
ncbi:MAG: hypothetical protein P4L84_12040 [Isosphaeraceae bacterium]|nr:hypothetical protein [Isosphaeraceae bacterium]